MFFGHKDKVNLFTKLVRNDTLGHAYLFYGDSQVGKFLFSRCFVNFLEFGCFEENKGTLIDSVIVEPDGEGKIGIGVFRDLKTFIFQKPLRAPRRVVVINDAERLTDQAQASMLKMAEDPPSYLTLIFIARSPGVFIPPLSSRLAKIHFSRLPKDRLKNILVKHLKVSEDKAQKIAGLSFGRMGRALKFLAKNETFQEEDLSSYTQKKIVDNYLKDKISNSKTISKLLMRNYEVNKFNLNPKLQKKAIDYIIRSG